MRIALFSDCFYSTLLDADRSHRPGTETIAFGDPKVGIAHTRRLIFDESEAFQLPFRFAVKQIKRSDLRAAVKKTVSAQSQGAAIRGFSEEKENGQTFYEAEMTVDIHGRDVLMDPAGAIVAVEEQVALDSLTSAERSKRTLMAVWTGG